MKQAQKKPEQNPREITNKAALAAEQKARVDALNERTEDDIVKEKLAKARHFKPEECLFCNHTAASLEESLAHMTREHSFFIPDLDFCTDVEGLIKYLGQKIGVGGVCLFCLKEFSNAEGRLSSLCPLLPESHLFPQTYLFLALSKAGLFWLGFA